MQHCPVILSNYASHCVLKWLLQLRQVFNYCICDSLGPLIRLFLLIHYVVTPYYRFHGLLSNLLYFLRAKALLDTPPLHLLLTHYLIIAFK